MKTAPVVAFVGVVLATNIATASLGVVDWLGVAATAGTWLAGLAFVARDWVHDTLGPRWVVVCILIGAALSAAFSPALAVASATAFLLSELADFAVYAPLRERGRARAAVASNIVGSVVDSAVFLWIAGFPISLLGTQVALKVTVSTLAVLIMTWGRRGLLCQSVDPVHP